MKFLSLLTLISSLVCPLMGDTVSADNAPAPKFHHIGKFGAYCFDVPSEKWKFIKEFPKESEEDFVFCKDGLLYGNFLAHSATKKTIREFDAKEFFIKKISKFGRLKEIVNQRVVQVNGLNVKYLQILAESFDNDFIYDAYLYEGDKYFLVISTVCTSVSRSVYEESIFEFLNGFSIKKGFFQKR